VKRRKSLLGNKWANVKRNDAHGGALNTKLMQGGGENAPTLFGLLRKKKRNRHYLKNGAPKGKRGKTERDRKIKTSVPHTKTHGRKRKKRKKTNRKKKKKQGRERKRGGIRCREHGVPTCKEYF